MARWTGAGPSKENIVQSKGQQLTPVSNVAGYICVSRADQRVLCLYAENESVAEALFAHHLKQSRAKNVRFVLFGLSTLELIFKGLHIYIYNHIEN